MNKYLSTKLKVLSFLVMILVVFAHAGTYDLHFQNGAAGAYDNWCLFIQNYISGGLSRAAPGLFFIISAYLFFFNFTSWNDFGPKIYKRGRTLLVPYLLWSAYGILFLALLQALPQSRPFFNKTPISSYDSTQLLDTLFFHPVPYQFWFLRDLIVLIVLSPLLYLGVRGLRLLAPLLLLALWIWSPPIPFFTGEDLQAPFFFSLGIWLALDAREGMAGIQWGRRYGPWLLGLWQALLLVKTTLDLLPHTSPALLEAGYKANILLGGPAIWFAYDLVYLRWKHGQIGVWSLRLYGLGLFSYSFFIYAFHEPVLTLLKKALFFLSGKPGSAGALAIYFSAPLLTIGLAVALAYGLKKAGLAGLYAWVTGNR